MGLIHVWKDERDKPNIEITGQDRGRNILYGRRIDDPKIKVVRVGIAVPTPNKQYLKIQSGKDVYEQEAHSPVLNYYRRLIGVIGGVSQTIDTAFEIRKQDNSLGVTDVIVTFQDFPGENIETTNTKGYYSAVNDDTSGIALGSGNTAWVVDDYTPETLILQGTASGKLVYSATPSPIISYAGGVWTVLGRRVFDNFNADANTITVKEVVQFAPFWSIAATLYQYIDERTVLVTPKDIPYKSGAVFTYTRTLTHDINAGLTSNGIAILVGHGFGVNTYDVGGVYGAGSRGMKAVGATMYTSTKYLISRYVTGSNSYASVAGDVTNGLVAGYGDTAVDGTDFSLESLFANGTGANQLSYFAQNTPTAVYDSPSKTFTATQSRILTNSYAGNQIIKELGIIANLYTSSSMHPQFLMSRIVLGSPITLAQNESIAIIYDFTITHP